MAIVKEEISEDVESGKKKFNEFIEQHRPEIYKIIMSYMPTGAAEEHNKMVRDYPERQGKYGRPGLLLLTAQMFGVKPEDAMLLAAAQQLSEDWILMHDDVEDDSELRRGKPALQKIVGFAHAINAGDTLHMIMNRMLLDFTRKNGELGYKVVSFFSDMLLYTAEGQWYDNEFIHHTKDLSKATEKLYLRIVDSKTCFYTIHGPMQLGAMLGGASGEQLRMLREIGWETGVAFQIMDDVLDMTADEKHFGKQKFGDLYEGKPTIAVMHTYSSATPEEKKKLNAIYAKLRANKTKEEIDFIVQMVQKYKGNEYATKMAEEHGTKAEELVKKYRSKFPQNEYADMLVGAVRAMYKRSK